MSDPKISIVIPVYNGSNYLANAIDCALRQTYKNVEVIVVNDGSTDGGATEEIALSYGEKIRYFHKSNGGVSSALNYGIANMTGEYFSWLSHDDAYSDDKIQCAVDLLKAHSAVGEKVIAFTGGRFIDANDRVIGEFPKYFVPNKMYSGLDTVNAMTRKGTLNGCCMLIPQMAFVEHGGFDESLRYSQDSLMWYKLFLAGYSLVADNLPNVVYRLHRNQTSQLRKDLYEHDALVIAKILAKPLGEVDATHRAFLRYIKRLTKNQCNDAINYLYKFAVDNGYFGVLDRVKIKTYRFMGIFRYKIVSFAKKVLVRIQG